MEKLITAKKGSGYRINNKPVEEIEKNIKKVVAVATTYPEISSKGASYLANTSLINRLPDNHIAFRPGLPPLDVFPVNQWKKLLNNYWRYVKASGLSYSKSTGLIELKKSVATYLKVSRNIKVSPHQIVIVSGSLQSLYLIANTLINPGDGVVLENPVFPNVHSVFKSSQATIIPLGIDKEGLAIQDFDSKANKSPKLVHVTPSNQYPLGAKMSLQRRKEILNFASAQQALVIENDYENEIANVELGIPSIFNLDQEDRTIYMGTFNRLLHPSIRLGYMIVPQYLINAVEALQEHSHRFVSPSIQVVMNQFIEKNYLYQHIENCIEAARERRTIFINEFNQISRKLHIPETPFASFHLIAYFTSPVSVEEEQKIIQQLKALKITVFSLSKCYITHPKEKGLILGYASVRVQMIKKNIAKMKGIV